jgi:hypothetical protein
MDHSSAQGCRSAFCSRPPPTCYWRVDCWPSRSRQRLHVIQYCLHLTLCLCQGCQSAPADDDAAHGTICLALNHVFTHLSDVDRSALDYDRLLPVLMTSTFHSSHGLRSGYFLGAADADLQQISNQQFNWPSASPSYQQIESILKSPLISSLGPLSRLIAHTIDRVRDPWLVQSAVDDLSDFSRRLGTQWRQNKLSEIDASEESVFLHEEARSSTVPTLWRLLRSTLFAIVIILRSATGRVVGNAALAAHNSKTCRSERFWLMLTC